MRRAGMALQAGLRCVLSGKKPNNRGNTCAESEGALYTGLLHGICDLGGCRLCDLCMCHSLYLMFCGGPLCSLDVNMAMGSGSDKRVFLRCQLSYFDVNGFS